MKALCFCVFFFSSFSDDFHNNFFCSLFGWIDSLKIREYKMGNTFEIVKLFCKIRVHCMPFALHFSGIDFLFFSKFYCNYYRQVEIYPLIHRNTKFLVVITSQPFFFGHIPFVKPIYLLYNYFRNLEWRPKKTRKG